MSDRPTIYRGVVLPSNMTPACLDDVSRIINLFTLPDNDELEAECAVRIFEAVRAHLQ